MPSGDAATPARHPVPPLALLGGTFDPVHYGHLHAADDVRRALAPIDVALLPARDPPHRGNPAATAADRVAMLTLALAEFPALRIDAREIARAGKSYTVLTLEELRAEAPGRPLALVIGADALLGLPTWHRWQEVLGLAHLIVVQRPGVTLAIEALPPQLKQEWQQRVRTDPGALRQATAGAIVIQPVTPHAVSATEVRAALSRCDFDAVRQLLPPAVMAYIQAHRLYEPPTGCAVTDSQT